MFPINQDNNKWILVGTSRIRFEVHKTYKRRRFNVITESVSSISRRFDNSRKILFPE